MKNAPLLSLLALSSAFAAVQPAVADAAKTDPITPYADIRYRLELVDQEGLPEDATASTIRLRAGLKLRNGMA